MGLQILKNATLRQYRLQKVVILINLVFTAHESMYKMRSSNTSIEKMKR